ncbi:hypothetical protein ACI3EJ_10625 [Ligilactobacillus acidipiscis]
MVFIVCTIFIHQPVVIQLKSEEFTRLVLGVEDPEDVADWINNSIN